MAERLRARCQEVGELVLLPLPVRLRDRDAVGVYGQARVAAAAQELLAHLQAPRVEQRRLLARVLEVDVRLVIHEALDHEARAPPGRVEERRLVVVLVDVVDAAASRDEQVHAGHVPGLGEVVQGCLTALVLRVGVDAVNVDEQLADLLAVCLSEDREEEESLLVDVDPPLGGRPERGPQGVQAAALHQVRQALLPARRHAPNARSYLWPPGAVLSEAAGRRCHVARSLRAARSVCALRGQPGRCSAAPPLEPQGLA
mmetsp:Transcript_105145/g.293497  ORF Transcript_105145/g.293497 Transcript_105145/m.293497 type:complete len:257 (+) Transcript_105145:583-1353(+)